MIKLYGNVRTSAGRCHIMLEECGQKYETVELNMMEKREHKSPEFLKLNPNGKIPTLVDGNFVLWESLAINRYLADKFKPELLGETLENRALVDQWSIWSLAELQPPLVDMLIQMVFVPENKRDLALVEKCKAKLPEKLKVLNETLSKKEYIVGNKFTLADLNVASVANIGNSLNVSYSDYPNLKSWLDKIKTRSSFKAVEAKEHKR